MSGFLPYMTTFLAVILYAMLPALAKKFQLQTPPLAFIAITMAVLCVFATVGSLVVEKEFSLLKMPGKTWMQLIAFAFVNFLAFVFYMLALAKVPVAHYQLIGLVTPVVGAAFAYGLLGEPFKMQHIYGLAFMGAGLFIALSGGSP
ncbi:MAG: DMT family transporter [Pseudomonadota bacterium]|nr:DMT family transporter [Pseudomonadota bacterium]